MNSHQLFRRSRTRLALWYALVMGAILGLSGLGMYRSLVQSNWVAMERELESIAGTLHDSLEPILPASENPTAMLRRMLPELCLAGQPCNTNPTLIQRHTTGISDRSIYYIRLFDYNGKLLAFSPNQPSLLPETLNRSLWQTFRADNGTRYHQFTTILHGVHTHRAKTLSTQPSWGYLQIGRTLASFDAETQRIQWILLIGFPTALFLVGFSSWWLSGLAMKPIYQSYQQQQQFTANVAHELRSPLASLLATVEAILRLPGEQAEQETMLLKTVERQGRRLSQLIADLLLLTRLEQDTTARPPQPCCLNDIVADLTEELAELATAKDIHLSSQISDADIQVMGHDSQLYRLVSNLMANAIQYTLPGGSVSVGLALHARCAAITVKDTGIGIPTGEHCRIFERFYRVDCDRSRKTGGTGLGLAIAQAIVQRHQGQLVLESEIGQGSLFTVSLPALSSKTPFG